MVKLLPIIQTSNTLVVGKDVWLDLRPARNQLQAKSLGEFCNDETVFTIKTILDTNSISILKIVVVQKQMITNEK
jgi:hypothetical protein